MGASNFILLTFSVAFLFSGILGVAEGRVAVDNKEGTGENTGSALVPMETGNGIGNISTSLNLISHLVNMTSGNETETEKAGTGKSRCDDECPTRCQTTCNGNNYMMTCTDTGSFYNCICQCSGTGDGGGSDFIQPTASLFIMSAALSIIRIGGFGAN